MARTNKKVVAGRIIAGLVTVAIVMAFMTRDLWLSSSREISCDDGKRRLIDTREFTAQYWAYSVELEASLGTKGKAAAKLAPNQLQQLSEAMQQSREFRHFLVAGYNSCAIPKSRFAEYGARFQALDSVGRQIESASDQAGAVALDGLVRQYISLSRSLADQQ